MPRSLQQHLHPREHAFEFVVERETPHLLKKVLSFVERSAVPVAPQEVQAQFGKQGLINGWGGQSQATTRVLEYLHRTGKLRVACRDKGIKLYASAAHLRKRTASSLSSPSPSPKQQLSAARAVLRAIIALYQPLPERSLTYLMRLSGLGAPQLQPHLRAALAALEKRDLTRLDTAVGRFVCLRNASDDWLAAAQPSAAQLGKARILAPFDPVVWDRERFCALHGWRYSFEAYVPAPKRQLGYYALPLLWREQCVGWVNAAVDKPSNTLNAQIGYATAAPQSALFRRELDAELERLRSFLGAEAVQVLLL
jgi:uncharacterized protein